MFALPVYATSAQSTASSVVTIQKGDKIQLGWAGDLSLQLIKPSKGVQYGAQIAVNRTNAAGGISGFQISLEAQDDQCKGDAATTVAQKFASEPGLLAVVGHVCSGATIPASDVYQKARIAIVSASATAVKLTNRGYDTVNRVAFSDYYQALGDASYLYNVLKAKNIVVLDDNQTYGQGLAKALAADFTALGGKVVDAESIDATAKDYTAVLTKFVSSPPDVLFFGGYYGPGALLTQQMHQLGMTNTAFFSDDGVQTSDYIKLGGKDAEGQYASSTGSATLSATAQTALDAFKTEFASTFSVTYGDYDPYQPGGYDSAMLIINALKSVAKTDASGNLTVDREALIKAVRGTTNYVGLTGTLTCNSVGECGTGTVIVYQVKAGAWVPVKTYTSDDLKALAPQTASATMAATMSGTMMAGTMAPTMMGTMSGTMAPTMMGTMAATMSGTMAPTMMGTMSPTMAATK